MENIWNRIQEFFRDPPRRHVHKILILALWIASGLIVLATLILFVALSFTDLPSLKQLENPKSELATLIYASEGELMGRYYTENRIPVPFDSLSPYLVQALVATEDERFYKHSGIDFEALMRVAVKTLILRQESAGGGSTITQQLAKLLFTGQVARNLQERAFQKLKEWIIAIRLERKFTKHEIIAMYLNKFNFIYGAYGIQAASEIYFNKPQRQLKIEEAAMLIGMLKNPSLYNPVRRPDTVVHRRMVVLNQMRRNGLLGQVEYDSLKQLPLQSFSADSTFTLYKNTHIDGLATYFRAELAKEVRNILNTVAPKKPDGSPYDIYRDGLRIYTTIDYDMQALAEKVMIKHMASRQQVFFRHWRNRDPWTYRTRSELDIPLATRTETLNRLIRETLRYQDLRSTYLTNDLEELEQAFPDFNFHQDDRELVRLEKAVVKPSYLDTLRKYNILSDDQIKTYQKVLRSTTYKKLQGPWKSFREKVEKDFSTPTNMRVFTYENAQLEKDTVMSPLDSIKYHRMFLQTGIMATDPRSGQVKVWIGGVNQKYFQYDHVRANRQVGSTFKPFIYATAIAEQGFSPCYKVYDIPQSIKAGREGGFNLPKDWTPRNADTTYTGELLTLKDGLRKSKNTISVYLMKQLGTTVPVLNLIDKMGIDKDQRLPNNPNRYRITRGPSICLGATDLTVEEMTGAYMTFANDGNYRKPQYLLRIEDNNGKILFSEFQDPIPALNSKANYVMIEMMRYAKGGGFGNIKSDVGGKTGTTNEHVDGWYMGITPQLVVGTWVGGEERWIRFQTLLYGQGAYLAKPFFLRFLEALEANEKVGYNSDLRFYRPPGGLGIELDCGAYDERQDDELLDWQKENTLEEGMFGDEYTGPPNG